MRLGQQCFPCVQHVQCYIMRHMSSIMPLKSWAIRLHLGVVMWAWRYVFNFWSVAAPHEHTRLDDICCCLGNYWHVYIVQEHVKTRRNSVVLFSPIFIYLWNCPKLVSKVNMSDLDVLIEIVMVKRFFFFQCNVQHVCLHDTMSRKWHL